MDKGKKSWGKESCIALWKKKEKGLSKHLILLDVATSWIEKIPSRGGCTQMEVLAVSGG